MRGKYFTDILQPWKLILVSLLIFHLLPSCEKGYFGNTEAPENMILLNNEMIDDASCIIYTDDGNLLIAGSVRESGYLLPAGEYAGDLMVVKLTPSGKILWSRVLEIAVDHSVKGMLQQDEGSILILGMVGDTTDTGQFHTDVSLTKLNSSGTVIWQSRYGGNGNQVGYDMVNTSDGGYIIAGSNDLNGVVLDGEGTRARDFWLLKADSEGDSLWSESYGYQGDDYAADVEEMTNGNLLLLGSTQQSFSGQAGDNILLIRTNSEGKGPVNRILGGVDDENGKRIVPAPDGFFLAGNMTSGNSNSVFLYRFGLDIFSAPLYQKEYASGPETALTGMNSYGEDLFISGNTGTQQGDAFLLRIDQEGQIINEWNFGGPLLQQLLAMDIGMNANIILLMYNQYINGSTPVLISVDL